MRFADPNFLWAYLVLLIPLLIHLFQFRRFRKLAFSDLRLLREIDMRRKQSRRLRKLLIMATRMLALAALVTAFARPFLPGEQDLARTERTWIQIDNSFSMLNVGERGPLFEEAKELARELVLSSGRGERFRIYTNRGRQGGWLDGTEAIAAIDAMGIEPLPNRYGPMIRDRQEEGAPGERAVILSDFQEHEGQEHAFDSLSNVYLLALRPQQNRNISIDTAWLAEPFVGLGQPIRVSYLLQNHGAEAVQGAAVRLLVDGRQRSAQSVDLEAGESRRYELSYTPERGGWQHARLELDEAYASFDNTYYLTHHVKERHRILIVSPARSELERIFRNDPAFALDSRTAGQLDLSTLGGYDMVLLHEVSELGTAAVAQLKRGMDEGQVVMFIPSEEGGQLGTQLGGWALGSAVEKGQQIDPASLEDPFYTGVFSSLPERPELPRVSKLYPTSMDRASTILRVKDGTPVFGRRNTGRGKLFQLNLPLDGEWSDLPEHELWVLTVLRALFHGAVVDELAYALDRSDPIQWSGPYRENALELDNGRTRVILDKGWSDGQLRFWLNPAVDEAGIYTLRYRDLPDSLRPVALNHSRSESGSRYADASRLRQVFGPQAEFKSTGDERLAVSIQRQSEGLELWKHFVVLCLIFLLIEILLLRFTKS